MNDSPRILVLYEVYNLIENVRQESCVEQRHKVSAWRGLIDTAARAVTGRPTTLLYNSIHNYIFFVFQPIVTVWYHILSTCIIIK